MIPQILLNVLQTGAKFFFDLDPSLTEHLARNSRMQTVTAFQNIVHVCSQTASRCTEAVALMLDSFRGVKLQTFEG